MAGRAQPVSVGDGGRPGGETAPWDWDGTVADWPSSRGSAFLREYSDAVNRRLVARWLPTLSGARVLKTDVFDEAVADGLFPALRAAGASVLGIDVSEAAVAAARARHPQLEAEHADVRKLRFPDGSFDVVVSNSTLDHFESPGEVGVAVRELHRVLRPGGTLLITLDNAANPLVALRAVLPARALRRLGLVDYFLGAPSGPRGLARLLRDVGFDVDRTGAVMHFPRVAGRVLAAALGPRPGLLNVLLVAERLGGTPLRYATGQFVAARALKPPSS